MKQRHAANILNAVGGDYVQISEVDPQTPHAPVHARMHLRGISGEPVSDIPRNPTPSSEVDLLTWHKPSLKERFGGEPKVPSSHVDHIVGKLASLGYLHDPNVDPSELDPPDKPQLEHVTTNGPEGDGQHRMVIPRKHQGVITEVPYATYDSDSATTTRVMRFIDHNPQTDPVPGAAAEEFSDAPTVAISQEDIASRLEDPPTEEIPVQRQL